MHRSPTHMHHTPWDPSLGCPLLSTQRPSVSQAQQLRLKAHLPGGDAHVTCAAAARPQAPAEGRRWHRQADRHYLGLRQGLPVPGWFFAGIARGREKGGEKGPWGCLPVPQRQQTPAFATQGPNQRGLFEQVMYSWRKSQSGTV